MICPRCRRHSPGKEAQSGLPLARCAADGAVLVPARALADGDGDPFLGMVVGGRFAVLERLGAGSMGTVYRARQEAMGRDVALKIVRSERLLDASSRARFQQEARATSLLASPYTVRVFDFGEIDVPGDDPHFLSGSQYLAMELLVGESLGDRLKRKKRLAPSEAVRICRHALGSLSEAHAQGVVHRDLKPDNLFLVRDPAGGGELCRVLDFGIAKVLGAERISDALATQQGTVFGTPRYMAPEQAQGRALDQRSDLYSLGVILYHMLLGRPPFTDSDAVVVMAHHIKAPPPAPSEAAPEVTLPPDLEALLMRCIEKDPAKRPQSAAELVALLDGLGQLDVVPASATETGSGQLAAVVGSQREGRRGRLALVLTAALVVLAAGTALALVVGRTAAVPSTVTSATDVGAAALPVGGEKDPVRSTAAPTVAPSIADAGASAAVPIMASATAGAGGGDSEPATPSVKPLPRPQPSSKYHKFDRW